MHDYTQRDLIWKAIKNDWYQQKQLICGSWFVFCAVVWPMPFVLCKHKPLRNVHVKEERFACEVRKQGQELTGLSST